MTPPDFPAGPYEPDAAPSAARRAELITEIDRLPAKARLAVGWLTNEQLDTPYKKWTVRQIVHHLADSHANAYVRFRLTLTEESPTIKPYDETRWAELPDARGMDVEVSLRLLEALHARWVTLLRSLSDAEWERTYVHPEYGKTFRLAEVLGLYAHHGRHHTGQIEWLRQQKGWGG
jgi:uncharacterized damage-inducible protein DinB